MPAFDRPITLAEARSLLWKHATNDETDADGEFVGALNEAIERLVSEGVWEGQSLVVDLASEITDEVLNLPYDYDTMMAVQVDGEPVDIYTEDLEFQVGGPGSREAGGGGNQVIDLGFVEVDGQYLRQYKFLQSIGDSTTVLGKCRRRFQYLTTDTDLVSPANIGALKNALLSIHFESEADHDSSDKYWARAVRILNREQGQSRIGQTRPIAFRPFPLVGSKPKNHL